ncbi:hypothetical protein [Rhizobium sp. BT03]|uniref:hypothetical protein n=1 Tax=Rhizobium sp. BT03 TaxID=3045156 RepID=UPI0024B3DF09|nr:hypothetical protein [Rhizobium sp. BT03]WHO72387.1 hypothetical protein QMO80_001410 [Rhizobium sp. BT03]
MQNQTEISKFAASSPKSGAPSNYAILLFGMLMFPIIFLVFFEARKRRTTAQEWEKSHYELQYRSSKVFLLGILATILAAFAIFLTGGNQRQAEHTMMLIGLAAKLNYLLVGWVAVRSIRGLFLAGGQRAIGNPKSYWMWPSAAVPAPI